MKKLCSIITLVFISFLFFFSNKAVFSEESKSIVILHTNDFHGHMFPYEDSSMIPPPGKTGGFQYLATLIKEEREKNPGRVILLDGGDIAQGSIYSNLSYGIPVVELMNYLKYDAFAIGNHEFDWGEERLVDMIKTAQFPVLSANVIMRDGGNFIKGAQPYTVKNINGLRVGIIGLTITNTSILGPSCEVYKYDFLSPEETARNYISLLKSVHKADLIVVLSHLGLNRDKTLAEEVPGIDVIVGAHTHIPLEEPLVVKDTIILQADCYMKYLGKLEIEYDPAEKKIISYKGKLMKITDSEITPDPEVTCLLNDYTEKYASLAGRIVGKTSVDLMRNSSRESTIGNLFTDIIKDSCKADIGMINSKGIRVDIPAGDVTMEQIYAAYPFDDIIVSMDLKGKDIMEILEQSVEGSHSILQVSSGLKLKYNMAAPPGERLIEAKYKDEFIDPMATYKVATIDFLVSGGDGYEAFSLGENVKYTISVRDALVNYFTFNNPVVCKIEGRIEIVE